MIDFIAAFADEDISDIDYNFNNKLKVAINELFLILQLLLER